MWKKGQATVSSRITNHSEMLLDLIVTNKKRSGQTKGHMSPGYLRSRHDLCNLTNQYSERPARNNIITIRNFNKFNEWNFQSDNACAPFQDCEVFDDPTGVYYAWNLLFIELCNEPAPAALDSKGNQNNHESKIQNSEKGASAK